MKLVWGAVGNTQEAIAAARELANFLDSGGQLRTMAAPMRLEFNEACYAEAPVSSQQFLAGDGGYIHKTRFGLSPMGFAIGAATMVGNQVRKSRAAHEAAAQWRFTGQGIVYITDRRLTIRDAEQAWNNVWYRDVMTATCDGDAIELELSGLPGLRLLMPSVQYYFVLFYHLAFNQIIRPPEPR